MVYEAYIQLCRRLGFRRDVLAKEVGVRRTPDRHTSSLLRPGLSGLILMSTFVLCCEKSVYSSKKVRPVLLIGMPA